MNRNFGFRRRRRDRIKVVNKHFRCSASTMHNQYPPQQKNENKKIDLNFL